ncbi:cation:proton antiporter regulatory subunit [Halostella litorea]|uniref:cation:proton antiporter regulatory subunit n=1 Tax=Halostella litorea TaxID=2528831 RepID=UPI00109214A9|nr:TrkA C-terminal domain-containing protein [Halostella litorea]
MAVYESELPGVGKKYEIDLDDGSQLVVVIHNTGKRELFIRPEPDADSEKLFELSDKLARQVGTIMEGAYFQPIKTDTIETVLSEESLIEWVKVPAQSPVAGRTLEDAGVRVKTGASVIAIQRDGETITNPTPDTTLRPDDTLVAVGSRAEHDELESFVAGE